MGMREKLIEILSVPIYPHELADPTEVVADYLLDNDVVPVVRCKDCKKYKTIECSCGCFCVSEEWYCADGERKHHG